MRQFISIPFIQDTLCFYCFRFVQLKVCPERLCVSHVAVRTDLFLRDPDKVPLTDFFGGVRNVELSNEVLNLSDYMLDVNDSADKRCRYLFPGIVVVSL